MENDPWVMVLRHGNNLEYQLFEIPKVTKRNLLKTIVKVGWYLVKVYLLI